MNALEVTASKRNLYFSSIIKINNRTTIRKLRAVAKERGLRGYYQLQKADLVALLESPTRPPRRLGQKTSLGKVALISNPGDMNAFERQEMAKSRPVVKSKFSEWYDWLVGYVPESKSRSAALFQQ